MAAQLPPAPHDALPPPRSTAASKAPGEALKPLRLTVVGGGVSSVWETVCALADRVSYGHGDARCNVGAAVGVRTTTWRGRKIVISPSIGSTCEEAAWLYRHSAAFVFVVGPSEELQRDDDEAGEDPWVGTAIHDPSACYGLSTVEHVDAALAATKGRSPVLLIASAPDLAADLAADGAAEAVAPPPPDALARAEAFAAAEAAAGRPVMFAPVCSSSDADVLASALAALLSRCEPEAERS